MKAVVRAAALAAALASPAVAFAHHSSTATYDLIHATTVSGTLRKVDWVNPHIAIFIDAKGAKGNESWKIETNPPAWFQHRNITRADFEKAIGQKVTAIGNRAKDGSLSAYLYKLTITYADGTSREIVAPGGDK